MYIIFLSTLTSLTQFEFFFQVRIFQSGYNNRRGLTIFFCWTGRLINKTVWINIRFIEIFLERNYKEDFKGINMCCALHTYNQNKGHIVIDTKIKHTNNPSCNCTNLRSSCKIWKTRIILIHFLKKVFKNIYTLHVITIVQVLLS